MSNPLYISFLWHMHQPCYKDPLTGEVSMPWVRLHGIKDYLDMLELLQGFPKIKATFNLTPSLIEQIEDYTKGDGLKDKFLEVSRKPTKELTPEDKEFILLNFFMANWERMIRPYPKYWDLLVKRGRQVFDIEIKNSLRRFTNQELLDLVVLFNLCWFDPIFRENIPELREISKKGSNFTEEEKNIVLDKQIQILKKILPTYKDSLDSEKIEITTSPYFHPILPLLCNINSAKEAIPDIKLPHSRVFWMEDAASQVKEALSLFERVFGKRPKGMWPSEGSVSEEILAMLIEQGVEWIATDEEILYRSLQKARHPKLLYKGYILKRGGLELKIVFRDHTLSDMIGFVYESWPPKTAAEDFIKRLHNIYDQLKPQKDEAYLVSIILDGENAWEYYQNDGRDFLQYLYEGIANDPLLEAVHFNQFFSAHPPKDEILKLFAGSWINANFSIWVGHEEKNTAWDYLAEARDALNNFALNNPDKKQEVETARKELYIAEGSDWNWWYGPEHFSSFSDEFDRLFRLHITAIYKKIGLVPPKYLESPIKAKELEPVSQPSRFLSPVIDGRLTNYFEWLGAGHFQIYRSGGTMHQVEGALKDMYYGFDLKNLYLRIDMNLSEEMINEGLMKLIIKFSPELRKIEIPLSKDKVMPIFYKGAFEEKWEVFKEVKDFAFEKCFEISLNLQDLNANPGSSFRLCLFLEKKGFVLEKFPRSGCVKINVPTEDYEARLWSV